MSLSQTGIDEPVDNFRCILLWNIQDGGEVGHGNRFVQVYGTERVKLHQAQMLAYHRLKWSIDFLLAEGNKQIKHAMKIFCIMNIHNHTPGWLTFTEDRNTIKVIKVL